MRDHQVIILDARVISDYFDLKSLTALYNQRSEYFKDYSAHTRHQLGLYLRSLPGLPEKFEDISDAAKKQHGQLQMQLSYIDMLQAVFQRDVTLVDPLWLKEDGTLRHEVEMIDFVAESWLRETFFIQFISDLKKRNKFIKMTMNDLIIYSSNIINEHQHNTMMHFISNLVANYHSVQDLSLKIEAVISQHK